VKHFCSPRLATWLLRLSGWRVVQPAQQVPKSVIIFYPHTSNWDFVFGILARSAIDLPVHFAAKDSLFRWPYGWLFSKLGGLPVNRRVRNGLVSQMAEQFRRHERFYLAIAPEGTRRAVDHIKSGFYRVALLARVPLGCAFIDYPRREIGILDYLELSGDEAVDLARIAAVYAGHRGRHPAQEGRIAFAKNSAQGGD